MIGVEPFICGAQQQCVRVEQHTTPHQVRLGDVGAELVQRQNRIAMTAASGLMHRRGPALVECTNRLGPRRRTCVQHTCRQADIDRNAVHYQPGQRIDLVVAGRHVQRRGAVLRDTSRAPQRHWRLPPAHAAARAARTGVAAVMLHEHWTSTSIAGTEPPRAAKCSGPQCSCDPEHARAVTVSRKPPCLGRLARARRTELTAPTSAFLAQSDRMTSLWP
jgi:hypothetical protein